MNVRGDISHCEKIKMLEKPRKNMDRIYKNEHVKKANRRFRHDKLYLKDSHDEN